MTATRPNGHAPGALVRARGRNWVVLPPDEADVVRLRPIDGSDAEAVGIYLPLEPHAIEPSRYPPPDPENAGGLTGALLLRDAVRLGLRSGAGPFPLDGAAVRRSAALPVRAAYHGAEARPGAPAHRGRRGGGQDHRGGHDRPRAVGSRHRAPHRRPLCSAPVRAMGGGTAHQVQHRYGPSSQSSRIGRLERGLPRGDVSLYQYYRHLVVSIDFVKSEREPAALSRQRSRPRHRRRGAHRRAGPRGDLAGAQHQRYALVRDPRRGPGTARDPRDGHPPQRHRGELQIAAGAAGPLVRRAGGVGRAPLGTGPRTSCSASARTCGAGSVRKRRFRSGRPLSAPTGCRPTTIASTRTSWPTVGSTWRAGRWRRNVSASATGAALSILRCVLSSPRAARAVLENRKPSPEFGANGTAADATDADGVLSQQIMDSADEDQAADYVPAAPLDDAGVGLNATEVRRLNAFLRRADALSGPDADTKIAEAARAVSELLSEGYSPIVYCRFIQTAYYVEGHLQHILQGRHPGLRVRAVTGSEGDSEQRKEIVLALAEEPGARARGDGLPERGRQPPGPLRRRAALRPSLEPQPPGAAGGPGGPLRPAQAGGQDGAALRFGQRGGPGGAGGAPAQGTDHTPAPGHLRAGAGRIGAGARRPREERSAAGIRPGPTVPTRPPGRIGEPPARGGGSGWPIGKTGPGPTSPSMASSPMRWPAKWRRWSRSWARPRTCAGSWPMRSSDSTANCEEARTGGVFQLHHGDLQGRIAARTPPPPPPPPPQ